MANPEHVEIVKQGAEAIRKWRDKNLGGVRLDLAGANLSEAPLAGANLNDVNLSEANLGKANLNEANLAGADLHRADLYKANLAGANLGRANLSEANLGKANLHEANLGKANLTRVRGAEHVYCLETVWFTSEDTPGSDAENDAFYFETCRRPWPEHWIDWECLRGVGRLPLFGVSYTALILIPIVFYGLALYNDKIDLVRAWAEQVVALPDHSWHRLAPLVLDRLHPRPIPNQSFLLLVSTVLLAAGSTLYTFFSPSRIKEFSRDRWCDQLNRSLLHYWPLAWKYRYIRLACAACYVLGGLGAISVIGWKVWQTAVFIWTHSAWPWPGR
jgi:hypothetical protein